MRRILYAFLILCWIGSESKAQEQRVFSQFFMNPYIYNPAYVGVEGHTAFYGMYRAQWVGIDGAPTFSHFNFHTPLKGGIAVGAMAFNDTENQITTTGGKATVGYLFAMDKKHYIRFGMSLGAGSSSYDLSEIDVTLDPAFQDLSSSTFLIADFGVTYHFGHFNVGFAIPNLIGRKIVTNEAFSPIEIAPFENVMFKINYRGHINDDFAIEPHLIYRFSTTNIPQLEAAAIVHVKHIVWVGGGWRQDAGISALAGFKIKEQAAVGYAFELGNSDLNQFSSGTHEIHIGYHFGDRKKHHDHAHSFIKSHRKTAEERAAEAERRLLAAERRQKAAEERAAAAAAARQAREEAAKKAEEERLAQENQDKPVDNNTQPVETTDDQPTTPVETTDPVDTDTTPVSTPPVTTPPADTPTSETTVKRGSHFLELPVGHHLIAGAYKEFQHAEDASDVLFNRGLHETIVGYSTDHKMYYVVLYHATDLSRVSSEKERIKNMRGLSDIWILTVTE